MTKKRALKRDLKKSVKKSLWMSIGIVSLFILISGCALTSQTRTGKLKLSDANPDIAPAKSDIQTWIQQLSSEDKAIRDQARESLVKAGPAAIPALARTLETTTDFTPCWEAVNIMGYIGDAKAAPYLVEQSLKSASCHVRWRSIWALSAMPQETILPPLLKALDDQDESIRWNAAVALSTFDRTEAIPILKQGLSSHSAWTQWEAINALGRVHDQETVPALASLLGCSSCVSKDNQQEAIISLGKIGDSRATPALIKALSDTRPGIRWRAAMSLGMIKDAAARPSLEKCLETEHDELVISSVKEAIAKIDGHKGEPSQAGLLEDNSSENNLSENNSSEADLSQDNSSQDNPSQAGPSQTSPSQSGPSTTQEESSLQKKTLYSRSK